MIELFHSSDAGIVAVLQKDSHASSWIQETGRFFHDATVTERVAPRIQPGWTCVDAGANIGTFTVAMARQVGFAGRVHAFEPFLPAYVCLAVNTRHYHGVVTTHNRALSDHATRVSLAVGPNAGANHIAAFAQDMENDTVSINTVVLDLFKLQTCNFLKLDVEGWEPQVLRGAMDTIRRCRPLIFCEINRGALSRYGFTPDDILRPLFDLGYRMQFLDPSHSLDLDQVDVWMEP